MCVSFSPFLSFFGWNKTDNLNLTFFFFFFFFVHQVIVLDKLDYCANVKHLSELSHLLNFKFIMGDIQSADLVSYILRNENIDTIMHFAAQTHVDNSFGNSFAFTENNILGTHVLLESCKTLGTIKRFLHVSTDEVYGESSYELNASNTEHASLLEPTNPYSATKAGAEMLVMAYGRSYDLPYLITRGNNVYGPHQFPEKAIPKFIMLAKRGLQIPLHGDGMATRSYMHVADAASAFDSILHHGEDRGVYNIGAQEERTVRSVAEDICSELKLNADDIVTYVKDRQFNDRRYFIDCSKLLALGWKQEKSWEDGLRETIAWYEKNGENDYWGNLSAALVAHPTGGHVTASPNVFEEIAGSTAEGKANDAAEANRPVFLIYGRAGWIGGMLGRLLEEQGHKYYYGAARLYDRKAVEDDIARCKPTHILNAAGITGRPNVDWCESHKKETVQTNVTGILTLVDLADKNGIHVTNFATGCIYSYDEKHPIGGPGFTEDDAPNFGGSFYSHTKGMVEDLLKNYDNLLQLRLRMPIDHRLDNPRNFIFKIANYDCVVDVPNSMTVLDELVPYAIDGALRKLTGIYNFTNPGAISHNEVLQLYKDYCSPNYTWKNFSLEEQDKILAAPRSNNELCDKKIKSAWPQILNIKDSLIKYVFEPNKQSGGKVRGGAKGEC